MDFNKIKELFIPTCFDEVYGQPTSITFLKRIIDLDLIPNALVLYGSLGCGKTLVSKIFVKTVNCSYKENYIPCSKCVSCSLIDVYEFNSANYSQIENIRELIKETKVLPISSKYKFYILDEFHMLSNKSFNALLKEIENAASFIKFIFITTEINVIPKTLLSRCYMMKFNEVNIPCLLEMLKYFYMKNKDNDLLNHCLTYNKIILNDEIFNIIAESAKHSARIAINNLIFFCISKKIPEYYSLKEKDVHDFFKQIISREVTIKDFQIFFINLTIFYNISVLELHVLLINKIENLFTELKDNKKTIELSPELIELTIKILVKGFNKTKVIEKAYLWTILKLKTSLNFFYV